MKTDLQLATNSSQHMKMRPLILIIAALLFSLLSDEVYGQITSFNDRPFWRVKPKVFSRITSERELIVSVRAEKKSSETSLLILQGGGLVAKPIDSTFSEVQKYDKLSKVSDYFREIRFTQKNNELYIHAEAFHYHAKMTMQISPEEFSAHERKLNFRVIHGNFSGMQGYFSFEEHQGNLTLMGFFASYEYKKLPMPQFFVEFALEVVLQKVGGQMRSLLEKDLSL